MWRSSSITRPQHSRLLSGFKPKPLVVGLGVNHSFDGREMLTELLYGGVLSAKLVMRVHVNLVLLLGEWRKIDKHPAHSHADYKTDDLHCHVSVLIVVKSS